VRVVLKVTSSNEHYNGGCEYALLDLDSGSRFFGSAKDRRPERTEESRPRYRRNVLLGLFCGLLLRPMG